MEIRELLRINGLDVCSEVDCRMCSFEREGVQEFQESQNKNEVERGMSCARGGTRSMKTSVIRDRFTLVPASLV
jgi:hypothetical protein